MARRAEQEEAELHNYAVRQSERLINQVCSYWSLIVIRELILQAIRPDLSLKGGLGPAYASRSGWTGLVLVIF